MLPAGLEYVKKASRLGSVTIYDEVDPDTGETTTWFEGTARFYLPVTDTHKDLKVHNNGDLAVYAGNSYHIAVDASQFGFAAYIGILNENAPTAYEFGYELPIVSYCQ